MGENIRNVKTLIVCFVIALVALVPLRFVEVNNRVNGSPRVLGEESVMEILKEKMLEEKEEGEIEKGVSLPDIDIEHLIEVSY